MSEPTAKIIYLPPPGYRAALDQFSEHFEGCDDCTDDDLCPRGMVLGQFAWNLMSWPTIQKKARRSTNG